MGSPLSYFKNDAINPVMFGAAGDGATDSTAAIQRALDTGPSVYLPAGIFIISEPLTMRTGQTLSGSSMSETFLVQVNGAANGIQGVDVSQITLSDFLLGGIGSGTGNGINFTASSNTNVAYMDFTNLLVGSFGNIGIHVDTPIVTHLRKVLSTDNGGEGFQFSNTKGTPTSLTLDSCYAKGNASTGYEFDGVAYSALNGCASDSNAIAYALYSCQGVTLNGCGAENFTTAGWVFDDCNGCHLNGARTYNGGGVVVHVTDSTTAQTVTGLVETSPNSATHAIQTDSGTSTVVINPTLVTAASYASGTAYVITGTGGTTH